MISHTECFSRARNTPAFVLARSPALRPPAAPQYEALTSEEAEEPTLRALKAFLELDPDLPGGADATLGMSNARKDRVMPEGWPMRRERYEELVALVEPDARGVAAVVDELGLGDGAAWLARWRAAWEANLASCDAAGDCRIQLT